MTSPLLALFIRSLSEDAHGKVTYWTRAVLSGFFLLILFALVQMDQWAGALGLVFFTSIVSLQIIGITLVGLSYFGSAIAEEKEEQTLGLLRMTDLSPLSILLGKSTSRLCGALLLLAGTFPFTVFSVTLGGTSLGQVIATYCTIAAYTFLLCNVALLGSVLARHTAGAATFSTVIMGLLLASGPLLTAGHQQLLKLGVKSDLGAIGDFLWRHTPIARLTEILQTNFSGSPASSQVTSNLVLGTAFFFLAWAAFGRFCDRASEASGQTNGQSMRLLGMRIRRPPRLTTHVIAWKDFYFLYGGIPAMSLRVIGYLVLPVTTLATLLFDTSAQFGDVVSMFRTYLGMIFFIDVGVMAGRMFRCELNDQTLSTLAVLPVTTRHTAYRKARVLLLVAAPGALSTLGLEILKYWHDPPFGTSAGQPLVLIARTADHVAQTILFVHLVIWLSLLIKRGAVPIAIVAILALSALVSLAGFFLGSNLPAGFYSLPAFNFMTLNSLFSAVASAAIAAFLHIHSLRRLETLAGEG